MPQATPRIRYVGRDVHKETIRVAVAEEAGRPEAWGTIANDPQAVRRLVRQLGREGWRLKLAYDAGPTGYVLQKRAPRRSGQGLADRTAWIVAGLGERTDVEVVTVERDSRLVDAVRQWRWPRFVRLLDADVLEVLESLGSFDLVFADSYSGKYQGLDSTIARLKPGGLLLVDDMAPRPNASEQDRLAQADLLRTLLTHKGLQAIHMEWCTGVVLAARKRTA